MKPNWILVANASHARVLAREHPGGALDTVATFEHPESRELGRDLATDRAGHGSLDSGSSGNAFPPRLNPRVKEHEQFAKQLAGYLNDGVAAGHCAGIAVFASNPFLGLVEAHLDATSRKVQFKSAPVDLTSFSGRDFAERIEAQLAFTPA